MNISKIVLVVISAFLLCSAAYADDTEEERKDIPYVPYRPLREFSPPEQEKIIVFALQFLGLKDTPENRGNIVGRFWGGF